MSSSPETLFSFWTLLKLLILKLWGLGMSYGCDKGVLGVSQAVCQVACAGCPHCPTSGGCSEGTRARQVPAACASTLPPAHMGHCWWFLLSCLHWSSHHCWCCNISDCDCTPGKSKVIIGKASSAVVWVTCAWGRIWLLGEDAAAIDSMSESMPAALVLTATGLILGFSSRLSEVCG